VDSARREEMKLTYKYMGSYVYVGVSIIGELKKGMQGPGDELKLG
jgi:hypothetical protein